MSENKLKTKFIGITIGPIYDTLCLTSTPAGLWGSSYLFSIISLRLCEKIVKAGVRQDDFLVPYFEVKDGSIILPTEQNSIAGEPPVDMQLIMNSGVGLFHDRVIFNCDNLNLASGGTGMTIISKIIAEVKNEIANNFQKDLEKVLKNVKDDGNNKETIGDLKPYFQEYLQIYAVEVNQSDGIPFGEVSQYLDSMELQKSFVRQERLNYILRLFNNSDEKYKDSKKKEENSEYTAKNERIKQSFLVNNNPEWILHKSRGSRSIMDLENISVGRFVPSEDNKAMKKHSYYAVVQADGDNMGKILGSLDTMDEFKIFSKACLQYCAEASKIVHMFGGKTIYAGGDDLLFLSPIENGKKSILTLLKDIQACFDRNLKEKYSNRKDKDGNPISVSVSFGVSIQFYKFPLYEAFRKAFSLLDAAKSDDNGGRNAVAINLQKHSGQSIGLVIKNFSGNDGTEKIEVLIKTYNDENFLKSVCYKIYEFEKLFVHALEKYNEKGKTVKPDIIDNVFRNTFDSSSHNEYRAKIDNIASLMKEIKEVEPFFDEKKETEGINNHRAENCITNEERVATILYILRFVKFFTEKGSEKDA